MNEGTVKQIWQNVLGIVAVCIVVSFALSLCRLASRSSSYERSEATSYCKPLMLDQVEPFISTRWFCAKDPS